MAGALGQVLGQVFGRAGSLVLLHVNLCRRYEEGFWEQN
jgi:hypothetical protein